MRVSGSRKGEEINIHEGSYTLEIGGIISDIAALTAEFDAGVERALNFLRYISLDTTPVQDIKYLPEQIDSVAASEVLRAIILWQPFLCAATPAMKQQAKYELSFRERTDFWNDEYEIDKLHKRIEMLRARSAVNWDFYRGLMEGNEFEYKKEELATLKKCFSEYYKWFDILVAEIKRIRTHLKDYLEGDHIQKAWAKKEICSIGSPISMDAELGSSNLFKKNAQKKYTQVFIADGIYELVALELNLLEEIDRDFIKCKLCGRYFVPYSSENVYCRNKNVQYGNKLCSEVGPNIFYVRNRTADPLKKEYDKSEKAYDKWYRDNIKVGDEKTASEMKSVYESWKAACKQAIEAVERGEMTEEEAGQIIKLPKVRDRSEKLYKIRKFGTYEK